MACHKFYIDDKVIFNNSSFFERTVGIYADFKRAQKNKEVFTVCDFKDLYGDQFVYIRNQAGGLAFGGRSLNSHLFANA